VARDGAEVAGVGGVPHALWVALVEVDTTDTIDACGIVKLRHRQQSVRDGYGVAEIVISLWLGVLDVAGDGAEIPGVGGIPHALWVSLVEVDAADIRDAS